MKNLLLFLLLSFTTVPPAAGQTGRIIRVHDGDTYTVLTADSIRVKLRAWGIDCPEIGQPYGREARDVARALLLNEKVSYKDMGKDKYHRTLARIYISRRGINLNRWLLMCGYAWYYTKYNDDEGDLFSEGWARTGHLGLWADSSAVAPWEWRLNLKVKIQK